MNDEIRQNGVQKEPLRFAEIDNYQRPTELKQTRSMQSITNSIVSDSGVFSYVRQPQVVDDRTELNGDLPILLRVSTLFAIAIRYLSKYLVFDGEFRRCPQQLERTKRNFRCFPKYIPVCFIDDQ